METQLTIKGVNSLFNDKMEMINNCIRFLNDKYNQSKCRVTKTNIYYSYFKPIYNLQDMWRQWRSKQLYQIVQR